ncbi:MAG: hypothetical protein MUO41_02050 [Methyloceanibacter sp.]|nr:hypothetical protein [Methyloceanibacter sp.]
MDDVLLDQILVGSAASLVNLVIHALLLGIVAWTVRNLSLRDTRIPGFLQYTLVIVAVGTLLVMGHFSEVLIWAHTYDWVDATPPGTDLSIWPSAITPRWAMATLSLSRNGICLGR